MEIQTSSEMKELFTKTLLKDRQIAICGEITNELAMQINVAIIFLNAESKTEEIVLNVESSGGKIIPAFDIYDAVRCSAAPVRGVVYRMCNSAAITILQACKKRQAHKHADIMVHNIQSHDVDIDEFDPELREKSEKFRMKHAKRIKNHETILEILSARTGLCRTDIIAFFREEKCFTAEEALKYGFIDEVI